MLLTFITLLPVLLAEYFPETLYFNTGILDEEDVEVENDVDRLTKDCGTFFKGGNTSLGFVLTGVMTGVGAVVVVVAVGGGVMYGLFKDIGVLVRVLMRDDDNDEVIIGDVCEKLREWGRNDDLLLYDSLFSTYNGKGEMGKEEEILRVELFDV
jgi:hypothetical protein